jgi:hypothetical protein
MSDHEQLPQDCEAVQRDLAELALGTLSGRERSEALAHVAGCGRCAAALAGYSTVLDSLVQLAPAVEPPVGFEQRLMQRLDDGASRRRVHPRRRAVLAGAAVVLIAAAGFGAGTLASSGSSGGDRVASGKVAWAPLRSDGETVGDLFVSTGNPTWLFMTVDVGWASSVTCQVTLAGGKVATVGRFSLAHGYGSWAAPLAFPASQVTGARLVADGGSVVAAARIAS